MSIKSDLLEIIDRCNISEITLHAEFVVSTGVQISENDFVSLLVNNDAVNTCNTYRLNKDKFDRFILNKLGRIGWHTTT